MSKGQLMFYCGAGLLALTIILTIIFIAVKPKYRPESPAAVIPEKKKKSAVAENNETVLLYQETELQEKNETEIIG